MKKIALVTLLLAPSGLASASGPAMLSVTVKGITDGKPIAEHFAYCMPDGSGKTKNGGNINPEISWSGAPTGTKSFAIIVVDPDVPASFELANQEDKTIPASFPRQNFYHWVMADIPPTINSIGEGEESCGVTAGGKPCGKTAYGTNGSNNYPGGGYDGPCPPWNDERMHHYYFQVFALDVASLGLSGKFSGQQLETAMQGHVLASGKVVGTYTNNVKLLGK